MFYKSLYCLIKEKYLVSLQNMAPKFMAPDEKFDQFFLKKVSFLTDTNYFFVFVPVPVFDPDLDLDHVDFAAVLCLPQIF